MTVWDPVHVITTARKGSPNGARPLVFALHGLVKGKCGRGTGKNGVAGDGAGIIIEYDGQPWACAASPPNPRRHFRRGEPRPTVQSH
jgi:hypothetical protein